MDPKYWMITNRMREGQSLTKDRGALTYWMSNQGPLTVLKNWKNVSAKQFKDSLIRAAGKYPFIADPAQHEKQKHVTLFIHGYNTNWEDAVRTYEKINANLFEGQEGLGLCILFSWPSDGVYLGYFPDRLDARHSAPDLSHVLNEFYDWLLVMQKMAVKDPKKGCRAKTSVIAHSMGNYLLQKAIQYSWTHMNQPLLVALINQLLMVAADVDNDLFKSGEGTDKSDGDAIANLTYRVTALYTGRDTVLGMSAGLKHFGKRRLGRSGLDPSVPKPDNVWEIDCSTLIPPDALNMHSAYFDAPKTIELMRQILRGVDRKVLIQEGLAPMPSVV